MNTTGSTDDGARQGNLSSGLRTPMTLSTIASGLGDNTPADAVSSSDGLRNVIISMIKFRRRILVAFFGILIIATYWAATSSHPTYISEAKLLVRPSRADLLSESPGSAFGGNSPANSSVREYLSIQLELLTSADVNRRLAKSLVSSWTGDAPEEEGPSLWNDFLGAVGINLEPPEMPEGFDAPDPSVDRVRNFLRNSITVRTSYDSPLIFLSCRHGNPYMAKFILEALLDAYREARADWYELTGAAKHAQADVDKVRADLGDAVGARAKFRVDYEVEDPIEQLQLEKIRLEALVGEDQGAISRHIEAAKNAEMLKDVINKMAASRPSEGRGTPGSVISELLLQRELLTLEKIKTAATPEDSSHQSVLKQLKYIDEKLRSLGGSDTGSSQARLSQIPGYSQLFASLQSSMVASSVAKERSVQLQKQMVLVKSEISRLSPLSDKYSAILGAIKRQEDLLGNALIRLARLERERDYANSDANSSHKLVQSPTLAMSPDGGSPMRRILLGIALAIFVAGGVGFVSGMLDATVRSPSDLEDKGYKVFAFMPNLSSRVNVKKFELRYGVRSPDQNTAVPVALGRPDLCTGALTNQLDRLVRAVRDHGYGRTGAAEIVICGARSGDGVTTVALSLARRLSVDERNRVLLVDWNSADPDVSQLAIDDDGDGDELLRPSSVPGLDIADVALRAKNGELQSRLIDEVRDTCDYVVYDEGQAGDFVRASSITGVDVVDVELRSQTIGLRKRLIDKVRERYDYVVYDAGSITSSGEALELLEPSVAVAMVVHADKTPMPVIREGVEIIRRTRATFIGTFLNGVSYYFPGFVYSRS